MELWNVERHHCVMLEYVKLKYSFYSTNNKLLNEHITPSERRSLDKVADELLQNISEFQEENKFFLEYLLNKNTNTAITKN